MRADAHPALPAARETLAHIASPKAVPLRGNTDRFRAVSQARTSYDDGGHENLPVGGHRMSPVMAGFSPHWRPSFLPTVLS
jgi:hypothetical protein